MKVVLKPKKQENFLTPEKEYFVIGIEADCYRIINDMKEPVLFSPRSFYVVDLRKPKEWIVTFGEDKEKYAYPEEMNASGFFEDYFDDDKETKQAFWRYIREKGWG